MTAREQSTDFVLIVDDTPTNISVLAQTLRQAGLPIRVANDGLSALKQIQREPPALILLDVQMPGIDGFETCRRLKADESTRHIPIIFMTALTDKASRVEGLMMGAVDYIAKPFEQEEILARVRVHMELKQLNDQLSAKVEEKTQSLEETRSQLIEQEKLAALGQLMAGVAHEINNPMSCIANNIEPAREYVKDLSTLIRLYQQQQQSVLSPGLSKQSLSAQIEELWEECDIEFVLEDLPNLLNSMKLSIGRIKALSRSLRNFSRSESTAKVPVDIHSSLDSTLIILGHRLKSVNARAKVNITKRYGQLPPVQGYPSSLNQVFMNILANALDALENTAQPGITIQTELVGSDQVKIEIADNGPGIPPEAKAHLFEPLFTTKPLDKGTGLGLSISHEIVVDRHNGQLSCLSALGEGCCFVIVLPVG
ncbi:MAG: response regulator [Cyanobacteria bacterium J06555_13]